MGTSHLSAENMIITSLFDGCLYLLCICVSIHTLSVKISEQVGGWK